MSRAGIVSVLLCALVAVAAATLIPEEFTLQMTVAETVDFPDGISASEKTDIHVAVRGWEGLYANITGRSAIEEKSYFSVVTPSGKLYSVTDDGIATCGGYNVGTLMTYSIRSLSDLPPAGSAVFNGVECHRYGYTNATKTVFVFIDKASGDPVGYETRTLTDQTLLDQMGRTTREAVGRKHSVGTITSFYRGIVGVSRDRPSECTERPDTYKQYTAAHTEVTMDSLFSTVDKTVHTFVTADVDARKVYVEETEDGKTKTSYYYILNDTLTQYEIEEGVCTCRTTFLPTSFIGIFSAGLDLADPIYAVMPLFEEAYSPTTYNGKAVHPWASRRYDENNVLGALLDDHTHPVLFASSSSYRRVVDTYSHFEVSADNVKLSVPSVCAQTTCSPDDANISTLRMTSLY